jgi:hypothetical protein
MNLCVRRRGVTSDAVQDLRCVATAQHVVVRGSNGKYVHHPSHYSALAFVKIFAII